MEETPAQSTSPQSADPQTPPTNPTEPSQTPATAAAVAAAPTQSFQFSPDEAETSLPAFPPEDALQWTASEFIAHHKTPAWYITLAGSTVVAVALIYVLTRGIVSSAVIIFAAMVFGFYASRQPRQVPYEIDNGSLHIGNRAYELDEFRSFSIVPEGVFSSIVFMPLKRFSSPVTIYYPPESESHIIAILSERIPNAPHTFDAVERLMRKVRF